MKKGFTLAEVMITLTVIGIITAVILPVAFHSKPDENVMKFKKAHNTLYQVITTLINSDEYYLDGNLGKKPDGNNIRGSIQRQHVPECVDKLGTQDDVKYFCKTFSDVITTKTTNCSSAKTAEDSLYTFVSIVDNPIENWQRSLQDAKSLFDSACIDKAQEVGSEIVTPDNITYYQVNPAATFGTCWGTRYSNDIDSFLFERSDTTTAVGSTDYSKKDFVSYYKIFCIDIDGISKGENPFGYGIRIDGKIISGKRADEWLEKSIQGEN